MSYSSAVSDRMNSWISQQTIRTKYIGHVLGVVEKFRLFLAKVITSNSKRTSDGNGGGEPRIRTAAAIHDELEFLLSSNSNGGVFQGIWTDGGCVEIRLDAFGGESIGSEVVRRSRPENFTIQYSHNLRILFKYVPSLEKVYLLAVRLQRLSVRNCWSWNNRHLKCLNMLKRRF